MEWQPLLLATLQNSNGKELTVMEQIGVAVGKIRKLREALAPN